MSRWLELLAEHLSKSMAKAIPGHAARLNGLDREEARELCALLKGCHIPGWDVMVVTSQPESPEEVSIDVAVERRNDKSQSRLFIVPVDLVAEAAASLADTEVHEVIEYLKPLSNKLFKLLPEEVRKLVQEARKRVPEGLRLDYLSALPDNPTLADCGREFWRLGLIPDLSPQPERLVENRDCVKKLTQGAGGSIHKGVDELGLDDSELKRRLIDLLRETPPISREWLRRIAEQPELELTFERWSFSDRPGTNLTGIEVLSFIDPKNKKAYSWSGLKLEDDTLKASVRPQDNARLTIKWTTEPTTPTGNPLYEITLETSEADPVTLLRETQSHKLPTKTQSWRFKPAEVEGIEGGSLRVRVVIRAYPQEGEEPITGESDEFLLVSEEVEAPTSTVFPLTRSLPDFMLERAAKTKSMPQVTRCVVEKGTGIKLELDERQRRRITLNPVLEEAQRRLLAEPNRLGCLCLTLSPEIRWRPEDLQWSPFDTGLANFFNKEWWTARRKLFAESRESKGTNLVEGRELSPNLEDILLYARGYARALETILEDYKAQDSSGPQILADLLALDTIHIGHIIKGNDHHQKRLVGLLLSPLHPLRLLWHLAHEKLIKYWISTAGDKKTKAYLPKPEIALQLDGGNYPAFLATANTMFYYFESPFFFWPLYINAQEEDPHQVAALVRWSLGLGTLETLTEGQSIATEALSARLQAYLELHPYVRTLKVDAVNCGEGQMLVRALAELDGRDAFEDQEEDSGTIETPARGYEVRLYGPSPIHQIGAFFDDCASQRLRGQGLPQKLDRLFRPGESFLHPHLFWAKRELKDIETEDNKAPEEAHVSFINEYFRPKPALVHQTGPESPVSTFGLQVDLADNFTVEESDQAWYRTVWLPPESHVTPHPEDRRLTQTLLRLQRVIAQATASLMGGNSDQWPATKVPVGAAQFQLFSKLHENSDWVLTVDRNLGVELFDSPMAPGPLKENADRFLIDYTPLQVGSAGQQLMVSTSWVEEVGELLKTTLREMLISPTDLACGEVLRLLKSISGRLVMRVARFPWVAKEAVSLAVVREVLRGSGELEKAFLVPIDGHIPFLFPKTSRTQSSEQRRPDLLLVRPRLERKALLEIDFMEVKYRRHRYMAYDRALWADMLEATRAGSEALSRVYFPPNPSAKLDLPLHRRQLRGLFAFYVKRSVRHGLLEPETGDEILKWLVNLAQEDITLTINYRGFIYSPELDFDTEEDLYDEMKITLIGREALPRYTSFHPSEPPSVPGRKSVEDEFPLQQTISDNIPALHRRHPITKFETSEAKEIIEKAEKKQTEISILIGREPKTEKPVYFRPSIRGNPHALIVGIPGMGKTTAIKNICYELTREKIYPFIFDFHGDLAKDLHQALGSEKCLILDAANGLPFNPLEVDPVRRQQERGWITHYFEVAEIFADIYPSFGELQVSFIRQTLKQCYEGAGFAASPSGANAPRFSEFWKCLGEKAGTDREARKIAARLEPIFELGLFKEELDTSFLLSRLLQMTTILDLHSLEIEENQRVAASFFLQRLYRDMFSHAEEGHLRNAVILDEAHRVARLSLIPKMMQECRKYGILFVLASQRVEDFDKGVLDSAGNHLYLRVNHPDARRLSFYLAAREPQGDLTKRLQNLGKFHALFRSEHFHPFVEVLLIK
ncbi:MAG: ATP-binding protein [Deltaproteobacteria bacterium]|nr:ATP-binding protein [Deltaproteobacteria bacterium]